MLVDCALRIRGTLIRDSFGIVDNRRTPHRFPLHRTSLKLYAGNSYRG